MGTGWHGHFPGTAASSSQARTLTDNLTALTKEFTLQPSGFFGEPGQSKNNVRVRNITSADAVVTSQRFYALACEQAVSIGDIRGPGGEHKGYLARMRDGTIISYRWSSSSDGSPAVDINIQSAGSVKRQKIHFIQ